MLIGILLALKERSFKEFIVAFLISLSWVIYYGYNYVGTNLFLFGKINFFALTAWTLGLMIFGLLYSYVKKQRGILKAVIWSGVIYLASINILEWIGYNILKIQLISSYNGLFNLELMHGPWWLKVYYLTVWIIYIGIIEIIKVDKE